MNKQKNFGKKVKGFLVKAKDMGVKVAPDILQAAGAITGIEALENLSEMIDKDQDLPKEIKLGVNELLELARVEMEEVSRRHENDMKSDSWLSKNVRPIVLLFSWIILAIFLFADAKWESFSVPPQYFTLLISLISTVTAFYFGGREGRKKPNV